MSDPVHDTPPAITPDDFPPPAVAEVAKPKRGRPTKQAAALKAAEEETKASATPARGLRRYRVNLNCPTPLRDPTFVVEAASEDEAKAKFERHNGICGSVHPYTVTEV